jgi:flagellar motor switch protein FliN
MPEENDDDKIEEEMLRMMQEESDEGGEGGEETVAEAPEEGADAGDAGEDADLESQMLAAMLQETGDEGDTPQPVAGGAVMGDQEVPANVARFLDVDLSVSIELGRTEEPISTVLEWTEGSLIELTKVSGDAVDVLVNGKIFARGEVVTIAENFGVRLTEILPKIGT